MRKGENRLRTKVVSSEDDRQTVNQIPQRLDLLQVRLREYTEHWTFSSLIHIRSLSSDQCVSAMQRNTRIELFDVLQLEVHIIQVLVGPTKKTCEDEERQGAT